jgi:HPt (histidine-containing phosphotransfer) domain-containing protein
MTVVAPASVDEAALERLVETLGDEAALGELIDTFLDEAPDLLSRMQGAVAEKNAEDLRRAAHTLKSNAATFGADALAEVCRRLEGMAEAEDLAGAEELVARIEGELRQLTDALEKARAGHVT